MHKKILHGKQISVQKSVDEKKSTNIADTGPNNPIEKQQFIIKKHGEGAIKK